jgi:hypothetical protein
LRCPSLAGFGCPPRPDARHLFDEGEQGQPAFLFQRRGDTIDVAVVDSEISDGRGDTKWGTRSCSCASFDAEVSRFLEEFESTLETAAPGVGRAWMLRHIGEIR